MTVRLGRQTAESNAMSVQTVPERGRSQLISHLLAESVHEGVGQREVTCAPGSRTIRQVSTGPGAAGA
eukprot:1942903-Rhodomonas_salina.1